MELPKTSLSAGAAFRAVLMADTKIAARTNKIFPVTVDQATLPYIVYRRAALAARPQKGTPPNDEIEMEIICYTATYGEGVELAELVRAALEARPMQPEARRFRCCYLTDAEETWENDAFVQHLTFAARI